MRSMTLKVLLPFEVFAQEQGVTRIVFETPAEGAERHVLGAHMGGGHHA